MKVEQFLAHHGIADNPFNQEDAQNDHIFREHCLKTIFHPAWSKIYSNPSSPATSVVFGEKGSGKTALRLQIAGHLKTHNNETPDKKVFIIEYDDFNPYLDCFRERLSKRKRKPEKVLSYWRHWDHMDAILSRGVTQLGQWISQEDHENSIPSELLSKLNRQEKRDLLLLAAFYNHSHDLPPRLRWKQLKRKLRFQTWKSYWDITLGFSISISAFILIWKQFGFLKLWSWWALLIYFAGWTPWLSRQAKLIWKSRKVSRQIRIFDHIPKVLRKILSQFQRQEIEGQPFPMFERSEDRYELLAKFQNILNKLNFKSIIVLVDRVDEPHLINGSPERMRDLIWPMLDNKFLKHPGIGYKLLLPDDVVVFLDREGKDFYNRSRLDKQNMIKSLDWTGESLYDVASNRLQACLKRGVDSVSISNLFEDSIEKADLIQIFSRLRVPRHLFKFLHRLLVEHCKNFTDDAPEWKISNQTLQTNLALFQRDLDNFDRGTGVS